MNALLGPLSTDDWMKLPEREQQLTVIADQIGYWIKYVTGTHEGEGLTVTPDTHVMLNGHDGAPPCWPSVGQLMRWLVVLRDSDTRP